MANGTRPDRSDFRDTLAILVMVLGVASIAVVSQRATLADAKDAMESTPNCQDVFVTKNGKREKPVVGWLTNVRIAEHARA